DVDHPIRLLYQMERVADEQRLDYRYAGLMVTDASGRVVRAVGLARGWTHAEDLGITTLGTTNPVLMDGVPVLVGRARLGSGEHAGYFYLFSSMLNTIPQTVANATGVSVRLQLDGQSLAWAGVTPPPSVQAWPWLGVVQPAREFAVSESGDGSRLSIRLAQEGYVNAANGWLDVGIALLLPALFYLVTLRRGSRRGVSPRTWWLLALLVAYGLGLLLVSRGQISQRPVPFAGHSLEFLLQLAGLLGFAVVFRSLIGERRSRRLSFEML
ncbi:MAG: hypothetical protein GY778_06645, partial [bacterium]|nr:hypothetical protein [bacterium]